MLRLFWVSLIALALCFAVELEAVIERDNTEEVIEARDIFALGLFNFLLVIYYNSLP